MAPNKLQIKILSKSGELLRCINCFAGQVTVFRAYSAAELQPFQRMFAGVSGPERIVTSIDAEPYQPARAVLVGFGESFPAGETVGDFLISCGLPQTSLDIQLRNTGIEANTAERCAALSEDFQRRLRLLGALSVRDKVLILNNPFEPISSGWRERFAEEITSVARNQNRIVVVPSLSYRPERWIDNDQISRIQVGQNTQRTIGFGGKPNEMNDLIGQLRAAFSSEEEAEELLKNLPGAGPQGPNVATDLASPAARQPAAPQEPVSPITQPLPADTLVRDEPTRDQTAAVYKSSRLKSGMAMLPTERLRLPRWSAPVAGVALVAIAALILLPGEKTSKPEPRKQLAALANSKAESRVKTVKPADPSPRDATGEDVARPEAEREQPPTLPPEIARVLKKPPVRAPERKPAMPSRAPQRPRASVENSNVLDLYPADIRSAVLKTFSTDEVTPRVAPRRETGKPEKPVRRSDDLFSLLETTSGSGKDLPATRSPKSESPSSSSAGNRAPISSLSREEIEERRQKIRQKFLEAIEKRAQQRNF